ncbi:hypothetical protein GC169_09200 [bacterium]|nr:hypothetical protein [bacterium]
MFLRSSRADLKAHGSAPLVLSLLLSVGLAASCGPRPAPQAEAQQVSAESETPDRPALQTAVAPPPCPAGRELPLKGICGDGDPSRFGAVNLGQETASPRCIWRTELVQIAERSALAFRGQDCSAEGWAGSAYAYANSKLKVGDAATPYAIDRVILEVFQLPDGTDAHAFALSTLKTAREDERSRCIIRPIEGGAPISGAVFELAPDDAYMTELTSTGAEWSACGDYGVGPDVRYWEPRSGFVLFHRMGADLGDWDPASFTVYQPNAEGIWTKAG